MEDQRIYIKFCVKNGFKGAEIFWMLQTDYGDAVISRKRVFEWYERFKEGREETAVNERSGRPSTSTTPEKVDKVLEPNARKETASLNLEATTDDTELLKRVITGDETWIYGFDSETTQQASEWRFKNEQRPKKARKAPSKVKVMLTVFFDYQGIVHHEFQQQGSTITADSYLGVLRRLREAIRQKRPELWRSKSWILHHDNSPAHTAECIFQSYCLNPDIHAERYNFQNTPQSFHDSSILPPMPDGAEETTPKTSSYTTRYGRHSVKNGLEFIRFEYTEDVVHIPPPIMDVGRMRLIDPPVQGPHHDFSNYG
ncbi:CLCN3 [Cordylochernes scorpioides]|uniref:CLCN3 n=1 Tax=Cordylochernes scorpioides TaxID=51811 RepID=A0ABY6LRC4_9ARAC|nr:CLCN3 [Cordylochernes scorpioides]